MSKPVALGIGDAKTNEDPSVFDGIADEDIVRVALEHSGQISPHVVNRPFTGLVKKNPDRAICALCGASRRGDFPAILWDSALRHWPDTAPQQANKAFYGQLRRLPSETIMGMAYAVGEWFDKDFPGLASEDWHCTTVVFDHFVQALLDDRGTAGAVQTPRPTFTRAINAPIGKAVKGLMEVLCRSKPERSSGLPQGLKIRFKRLVSGSGEGADDAVCVLSSRIAWLKWIDLAWVDANMIPCFQPGHKHAEAAWNGLLSASDNLLSIQTDFDKVKDGFLALPNTMGGWACQEVGRNYSAAIVNLAISPRVDKPGLSFAETRECLRRIDSTDRQNVICHLERVGKKCDERWRQIVVPFIQNAWPKEREYNTSETSEMWLWLLRQAGDTFPDVLEAVRFKLVVVSWRDAFWPDWEKPAEKFPKQTLDLLDRITPDGLSETPYGLMRVLDLLAAAAPQLQGDARYRRLLELATRE